MGVKRLSRGCGRYLEGVGRLSEVCGKDIWRMWGGFMKDKARLSGRCEEVVWGYGEAVWRVSGGCPEGWRGCLEVVQRLSGGCGKAI